MLPRRSITNWTTQYFFWNQADTSAYIYPLTDHAGASPPGSGPYAVHLTASVSPVGAVYELELEFSGYHPFLKRLDSPNAYRAAPRMQQDSGT